MSTRTPWRLLHEAENVGCGAAVAAVPDRRDIFLSRGWVEGIEKARSQHAACHRASKAQCLS